MTAVRDGDVNEGAQLPPRGGLGRSLREQLMWGVFLADALVLAFNVVLAWELRVLAGGWQAGPGVVAGDTLAAAPWIVAGWLVVLAWQGGYSARHFAAGSEEFRAILMSSIVTAGIVGMTCYLWQIPLSRAFVLMTFLIGTPALLAERYVLRKVVHRLRLKGRLAHRVLAVGGPAGINEVAAVLRRERYVGYDVVAACLPPGVSAEPEDLAVPVAGHVGEIREACRRTRCDTVLVARGGYTTSHDLRRIAWELEDSDIELVVVPSLTDIAGPRISMRPVAGLPLLHVEPPQAGKAGGLPKRMFDAVVSVGALVLLSVPMLAVALTIKLQDGGPVFFRQTRVGRDGDTFEMLKFRSMRVNADKEEAQLREADNHSGALWKRKDDPRVTRIGTFIRRYSIDELPQLFNVLAGQMSLVGPRPQQSWEVESYTDAAHRRLLVRPGMTGLWQVSGRSALSWDEAVRLDLYYVDNWSMTADLLIIGKTVRAVLGSAGAY